MPEVVDVAQEARAAREAIVALVTVITQFEMAPPNDRNVTATKLARASMDYGIALCLLGEEAHEDLGAPLISLHRMQMEHVVRGAFFCGPASDKDLTYFLKHDELPKINDGKRVRKMTMVELAARVDPLFDPESDGKLIRVVKSHYGLISGVVHGGRTLLGLYGGGNRPVGFDVDDGALVQIIDHSVAFANLAAIVVAKCAVDSPERFSELMMPTYEAAKAYVAKRQARSIE
jgi:hypothetical protein